MVEKDIVRKIAEVSRLNLTEDEIDMFTRDLDEVLDMFSVLDTAKIDDDFSTLPVNEDVTLGIRDYEFALGPLSDKDEMRRIYNTDDKRKMISLSPHKRDEWIKGPRV